MSRRSKRPTSSRVPLHRLAARRPPPPKSWWEEHARKLILAGSALAAIGVIYSYSTPVINSHLPTASQADLKAVDGKVDTVISPIVKELNNLDARQKQSIERGQAVADQLRSLRMAALRAEIKRLENAKDEASIRLVAQDEQELDDLMRGATLSPTPAN